MSLLPYLIPVPLLCLLYFLVLLDCAPAAPLCADQCSCLGDLVDCSGKDLTDIPPDLPPWTRILDMSKNKVTSPDGLLFAELPNLSHLDLSHNKLRLINGSSFEGLPMLEKLSLDHNQLDQVPEIQHDYLQELTVEHNVIHSLGYCVLCGLPNLNTLLLGYNQLVDLPADSLGNSTALKHLSLIHNRLVSMEAGVFDNLTSLESLKLSRNKLSSLQKEVFRIPSLQHLELNSLELGVIEGLTFQSLSSLHTLKLRHSRIKVLLDGSFYGLQQIKKLHLDNNSIEKVTKGWLYGLDSLQRLCINNNNISEIEDDAWDSGKRILELDMSDNSLQSVSSKTFEKLFAVKRLILSKNNISYIEEDSFKDLAALQYLDLGENNAWWSIEEGAGVWGGLRALRHLGLGSNRVRRLAPGSFSGLNRLNQLNLTGNPIASIDPMALSHFLEKHTQLWMNTSSLLCDCRLAWIEKKRAMFAQVQAKCGYPERLRGIPVLEVPAQEMVCIESVQPVLVREPSASRSTLKGENVTLECEASSVMPADILWRKDGNVLEGESVLRSAGEGSTATVSTLRLNSIKDEDEGRYQCVATNPFGSAYSGRTRVIVNVFPVFSKTPTDVRVRSGGTARLECGAKGQPRPVITWRKDDAREDFPAARERRMHVMPSDDVFFILNTRPQDAGLYSCYARNAAGTVSANATLTVMEFPSFVRRMEDKEARAGETAVMECLASGSPRPRLSWLREGKPLTPTERHFFTAQDQLLIIVQAQLSDAGRYSCNISNSLGSEVGHSLLTVTMGGGGGVGLPGGAVEEGGAGVVVIAVVICIVGTSIVWVVIIYHTRKHRAEEFGQHPSPEAPHLTPGRPRGDFLDSHSGVSRDSGRPSSDELLVEDERVPPNVRVISGGESSSSGSERSESFVSKERVPLLHTFRPRQWSESRPRGRCRSAEHLTGLSGSSLPRSATLASIAHSPHLTRLLPKGEVANDSGSFSIASEEPQFQEPSRVPPCTCELSTCT